MKRKSVRSGVGVEDSVGVQGLIVSLRAFSLALPGCTKPSLGPSNFPDLLIRVCKSLCDDGFNSWL